MIEIIDIKVYDENNYLVTTFKTLKEYEWYVDNSSDTLLEYIYPEFNVKINNELENNGTRRILWNCHLNKSWLLYKSMLW